MGFECVAAENHTGSRGVVALFRNNFEYKIHSTIRDELGRYIVTDIEFFNRRMTLGNAYGPSDFFEEVFNKITSFGNELTVVGGDWNVALNPTLDTYHPSNIYRNRSRGKIYIRVY